MDDNLIRAALAPIGSGLIVFLWRKLKAKAYRTWDQEGRGLLYCLGRWLGKRAARARQSYQRTLGR